MYDLTEYRKNSPGSLWHYYKDESANPKANSESFI